MSPAPRDSDLLSLLGTIKRTFTPAPFVSRGCLFVCVCVCVCVACPHYTVEREGNKITCNPCPVGNGNMHILLQTSFCSYNHCHVCVCVFPGRWTMNNFLWNVTQGCGERVWARERRRNEENTVVRWFRKAVLTWTDSAWSSFLTFFLLNLNLSGFFSGVLLAVGHFIGSFWGEMN